MIRINLLKSDKEVKESSIVSKKEKKGKVKKKFTFNYNLLFLLVIVIIGALFINLKSQLKNETALLESAQQEKAKMKDVATTLSQLEEQKTLYERKINLIKQLKLNQGTAVNILDELSKNLPEWVWLTETIYKNRVVSLKGKSINNNLIADYILNLENSPYFNGVNLVSSTQRMSGNNRFFEFSLNARYVNPPPPLASQENKEEEQK